MWSLVDNNREVFFLLVISVTPVLGLHYLTLLVNRRKFRDDSMNISFQFTSTNKGDNALLRLTLKINHQKGNQRKIILQSGETESTRFSGVFIFLLTPITGTKVCFPKYLQK